MRLEHYSNLCEVRALERSLAPKAFGARDDIAVLLSQQIAY
jgi:hypothetical protein